MGEQANPEPVTIAVSTENREFFISFFQALFLETSPTITDFESLVHHYSQVPTTERCVLFDKTYFGLNEFACDCNPAAVFFCR
jgi:hypothetical protein